jgi:hypothetical protein
MRSTRKRLVLAGLSALALGAFAGAGSAQGAVISATAAGGALADAPPVAGGVTTQGVPLTQSFTIGGKKAKKKQVTDVNLTVNSTGSAGSANNQLRAKLIAPSGDNIGLLGGLVAGQNLVNLKFDDQSELVLCNPLTIVASDCNFLQSPTPAGGGTFTGTVHAALNPTFKGLAVAGTWRLVWWDTANGITHTIGNGILDVSAGKKFLKAPK